MFFLSFKIAAPRPIEVNFVALGLKSLASPDLSDPSTYPIQDFPIYWLYILNDLVRADTVRKFQLSLTFQKV
jgi:hypothetical protein